MRTPYICLAYVPKLRLETHLRKTRSLSSFTWIICSCFSSVKMKNAEIIRYPSPFLIQPTRNMFASFSINMLLSLKKSAKKTAGSRHMRGYAYYKSFVICSSGAVLWLSYTIWAQKGLAAGTISLKFFLIILRISINHLAKRTLHPWWQCIGHKYARTIPDRIIQTQSVIYHLTPWHAQYFSLWWTRSLSSHYSKIHADMLRHKRRQHWWWLHNDPGS